MNNPKSEFRFPFSEEEIEFIKVNYPLIGMSKCAKKLGRKYYTVKKAAWKYLGIKPTRAMTIKLSITERDKNYVPKIPLAQFLNVEKPEIAYVLGLLWADGHLSNDKNHRGISISLIKEDFVKIMWIFDKIGAWSKRDKFPKLNGKFTKPALVVSSYGKPITNYLLSKDYKEKSYKSPDKILSTIPEHLKHYFIRGYLDGDGCIGLHSYNLIFTSTYEQDWSFLPKYFRIKRRIGKKGKNSSAEVTNKVDFLTYCSYIYHGAENDGIYLPRKYERFKRYIRKAVKNNKLNIPIVQNCLVHLNNTETSDQETSKLAGNSNTP